MPASSDPTSFSYVTPAGPDTEDLTGATSTNSLGGIFNSGSTSALQTLSIVITNILSDNKKIAFEPYGVQFTLSDGTTGYSALHYATTIELVGLAALPDVVITGTPSDNQPLAYNTATSKWINQTLAFDGIDPAAIIIESEGISGNDNDTTLPTSAAVKDYVDTHVTAQDLDFSGDSGGAQSIDLDSESLTLTGGTGIDTTGSAETMTFAIDSTVATLAGTQTLTNKTLTTPVIASLQQASGSNTLTMPAATDTLVGKATTDTLTNKTLTTPIIASLKQSGSYTLTMPAATDTLVGKATTDTLTNKTLTTPVISSISNSGTVTIPSGADTLVGRATTDTLTNKTLTTPVITSISNSGTVTIPSGADTLVARTSTDTLTNKTLTSPVLDTGISGTAFQDDNAFSSASASKVASSESIKAYVDSVASGLDVKDSVRVATTAAGTLASSFENSDTIDGITLATNDRILIKDQGTGSENGIYTVNSSGAPTRATDFDSDTEVTSGAFTFVEVGTTNADTGWVLTTDGTIVVGTTALVFSQFSGAGQITAGAGLTKSGDIINAIGTADKITVSADAITIASGYTGQTSITTLGTIGTGVWQGTAVADSYISSASTWNAKQAALTFGIADTNAVKIDDADAADNDYAKLTASGIEGRSYSQVKTDLSLGNVENTALSSWAGTSNITTLGTIGTGTWQGTAVADSYISSASTWNAKQAGDAALTSISGLTTAADKMIYTTGSDTYAVTALTSAGRAILDDADAAAQRTTLGLAIGTNVQAYDADLTTLGGLAKTDSNFIVGSGSAWVAETGATARTSLGLGNVENTALSSWAGTSNITTVGTLTTLSVDNITINGNDISSTAGTDLTITPLTDQQIVLDGTIVIDAGVVTGATSITSDVFVGPLTGNVTGNTSGSSGSTTGNAATATALATARTIGGTSFDGTANIAVGLAATATALADARTIGGVSFDGTGNINLPGVNTAGNQDTSGSAATLTTAREINGVSFNGSANITVTAAAGTLTGSTLNSGVTASSLTSLGTLSSLAINNTASTSYGNIEIGGTSGAYIDLKTPNSDDTDIRIITTGTGGEIVADEILLKSWTGAEKFIDCSVDGAVDIYHNNVKKFETTATGVTVTGTLAATAVTGDGSGLTSVTSTVSGAQTGITSILNTSLVVGRDTDNQIKFSTDDEIIFEVAGGDNVTFKASGEIEATSLDIGSGGADINGTLEADVITVAGVALSTVIANEATALAIALG